MRQRTLLHIAVQSENQPEIIAALVALGHDVNVQEFDGLTPLHMALNENANLTMVQALLVAGADPNLKDYFGTPPLSHGATRGVSGAIITALIDAGADIHAVNEWANTALHGAASNPGNLLVIQALVALGADINVLDYDLFSPLHFAAGTGDSAMIMGMINLGANPAALTRGKRYPLSFAEIEGGLLNTLALAALQAAATPNPVMPEGCQGWVTAPYWRDIQLVHLRACLPFVDINAQGLYGRNALHFALAAEADLSIIRAIISAGAELNGPDDAGGTALHYAAGGDNLALVRLLFESGAILDKLDNYQQTPLHRAAKDRNDTAMVQLLLDAGADPNLLDKDGRAAGDIAIEFTPENTGN